MQISKQIHIGREIEARINSLNISKTEFARRIGTSKQNVNRILDKESIDTAALQRYGEVLGFNFFTLYTDIGTTSVIAVDHSAASLSGPASSGNGCDGTALLEERIKHLTELIAEKDERIKELKERIDELKK